MSTTKKPMLSFTTAIFRGLQDNIRTTIKTLPIGTPSVLRNGLLEAHRKLSDYYYKFDQSPYYTWAALLDPRISYDGLCADFEGDDDLLDHLKSAKDRLDYHFRLYYADRMPARAPNLPEPSASKQKGSPQKDFTAHYRVKDRAVIDELQQYS
ncbi:hypothetical protein B0H10DRAFT_1951159 [Mycena sp. CBHHK59/15]|nr:hypothetical protein B0H10DRAFT_1951159 [Mycena sp. CBHHK59/15]